MIVALLKESDIEQIKQAFGDLKGGVDLILFTRGEDNEYCVLTRDLLGELSELSDKITLTVHDIQAEKGLADGYGVDKVPALVIKGVKDFGIRMYGVPSGYEFSTLIEDIRDVSGLSSPLPDPVLAMIGQVDQPVHIQVMVTPS